MVIAITIALVLGVSMIGALVSMVASNSGTVSITNESVTSSATLGQTYDLDGYDVVSGSETVYYDNGSGFLAATGGGVDYTLHKANGSITVASGGSIASGATVKASYQYKATSKSAGTVIDLLSLFLALVLLVAVAGPVQDLIS